MSDNARNIPGMTVTQIDPDLGKDAVGRIQARQARTKGKYGGLTQAERTERLRLSRLAADNLIKGTIAKNRLRSQ